MYLPFRTDDENIVRYLKPWNYLKSIFNIGCMRPDFIQNDYSNLLIKSDK